ncbi:unnamed protein product, partial [Polarella glacialis]
MSASEGSRQLKYQASGVQTRKGLRALVCVDTAGRGRLSGSGLLASSRPQKPIDGTPEGGAGPILEGEGAQQ